MKADKRHIAYTAAAMFGGAAFVTLAEGLVPGGPALSLIPGVSALAFVILLLLVGPRLPIPALAALGPIGAALIAYAVATTPPTQGDGMLLYFWPVLWVAYFFGRRGTVVIVAWIGVVHGAAMIHSHGVIDRWIDLMVSVAVVAVVVRALSERNDRLVAKLAAEARMARREGYSLAAATFDIDYFKRVNDEWGHESGDRVLEHLGTVLRAETRGVDVVARLGGEEFAALLPRSDEDAGQAYAERVREAFAAAGDFGVGPVTVSAGVTAAVAPPSVEALLAVADSALYAAKRAGRDRTVVLGQAPASTSPVKNSMSAF